MRPSLFWLRPTLAAAWPAAALLALTPASAGAKPTRLALYTAPGAYVWTVPAGVTRVTFTGSGAQGGNALATLPGGIVQIVSTGGAGGRAKGTFAAKPGRSFEIVVGGSGQRRRTGYRCAGGVMAERSGCPGQLERLARRRLGRRRRWSDVRVGEPEPCAPSATCTIYERIVVAGGGGGGGGGGDATALDGGNGGGASGFPAADGTPQGGQSPIPCPLDPDLQIPQFNCGTFGAGGPGQGGGGGGGWFGGFGNYNAGDIFGLYFGGGGGGSGWVSGLARQRIVPLRYEPGRREGRDHHTLD